MEIINCSCHDAHPLADLRERAMRVSLEYVGRFDAVRVRERLLKHFNPDVTFKIIQNNILVGFYVLIAKKDHVLLDHLYIEPEFQSQNVGGRVMQQIINSAQRDALPIRLCALKHSRANNFYIKYGFVQIDETAYDNHYEFSFAGKNYF